ncbi:hypothetical protein [Dankookia sp. P2]|uniref:hypothetical protein n=1 Tax=Dankookia sp. P2 TaxID=3423955 RepID=UPI003D67B032
MAELMKAMPDTSPKLKSALGKWPGLFARLVVVFHLIDVADAELRGQMGLAGRYQVPAATAARVAAYMRQVLLPHLLRADAVMYLTPQTGHARWIAGHILAHELKRVTKRDVVRSYGPLKPTERQAEIASVMESLVTMGWLAPEPSANAAKPPTAWQVNPKVQVLFAERAKREKERRDEAQRATAEAILTEPDGVICRTCRLARGSVARHSLPLPTLSATLLHPSPSRAQGDKFDKVRTAGHSGE